MSWTRFVVGFDPHGDMQDRAANEAFFKFIDIWKPTLRIAGGDVWDFRPLRKKATDEERRQSMQKDFDMGMEWLEKFKPQVFIRGNHDERLWEAMMSDKGPLADLARKGINEEIEPLMKKLQCRMLPYHKRLGVYRRGHMKVVHGFSSGLYASRVHALIYGSVLFGHTHCFTDDTEILTERGWKFRNELFIGERVYSYNIQTGCAELDLLDDVVVRPHFGSIVKFEHGDGSFLVTPEHDMVAKKANSDKGSFKKIKASELLSSVTSMPCGAYSKNPGMNISEPLLRLLGWIVSEGSYEKTAGHRYISIAQSDKPKVDHLHIVKILESLQAEFPDLTWKVSLKGKAGEMNGQNRLRYDAYRIRIRAGSLSDKIFELLPEKEIPMWMMGLSQSQFEALFKELVLSDGCQTAIRSFQYCGNREREIDVLQAILVTHGYRAIKWKAKPHGNSKPLFVLFCCSKPIKRFRHGKAHPFDGIVWCPVVRKNKTIIARRDGMVLITGNSIDEHAIPGLERRVARNGGCLCKLDMDYNARQMNTLKQAHGWPYGIINDRTGDYHVFQAEKIGGKWILPTDTVEL